MNDTVVALTLRVSPTEKASLFISEQGTESSTVLFLFDGEGGCWVDEKPSITTLHVINLHATSHLLASRRYLRPNLDNATHCLGHSVTVAKASGADYCMRTQDLLSSSPSSPDASCASSNEAAFHRLLFCLLEFGGRWVIRRLCLVVSLS